MSEIREQCQHRWDDILQSFGVDQEVLNGRHQACPLCGGKDRFRYTNYQGNGNVICNQCMPSDEGVDGFAFVMKLTGMDFKSLADEIRKIIGNTNARPAQNTDLSKSRARLKAAWAEASPLTPKCPTHLYLHNRGLAGLDYGSLTGLRCHPGMTYWHVEGGEVMNMGKHPAMLGLITTVKGEPASIHCTYLTKDGSKAALDPVKKIMPVSRPWKGGAIRLQSLQVGQTLCVAEGIETALAMKLMYPDVCPWAVVSAGNMESFVPNNDESGAIYIAGDNDENYVGQAAAFALAKRLSGKFKAVVLLPEQMGTDFLDEYNNQPRVAIA